MVTFPHVDHVLTTACQATDGSFKAQRAAQRKAEAGNRAAWNTLFMRPDTVAEAVAAHYGVSKAELLERHAGDLPLRMALGETHIIATTKKELGDAGRFMHGQTLMQSFLSNADAKFLVCMHHRCGIRRCGRGCAGGSSCSGRVGGKARRLGGAFLHDAAAEKLAMDRQQRGAGGAVWTGWGAGASCAAFHSHPCPGGVLGTSGRPHVRT